MPRFTGKTRNTGKTAEILERQNNNRELKFCLETHEPVWDEKHFVCLCQFKYLTISSNLVYTKK